MSIYQKVTDAGVTNKMAYQWLDCFQAAVQAENYDEGRKLFHQSVVAFGTITDRAECLDQLVNNQWKLRWPKNAGFEFIKEQTVLNSLDDEVMIILASWSTQPCNCEKEKRLGRATLVLKSFDGDLLCIHSHFSLIPC